MNQIFITYEDKLIKNGLAEAGAPLLGCLDADLEWNRTDLDFSCLKRYLNG